MFMKEITKNLDLFFVGAGGEGNLFKARLRDFSHIGILDHFKQLFDVFKCVSAFKSCKFSPFSTYFDF